MADPTPSSTDLLEAYKQRRAALASSSRLSLPTPIRLTLATTTSFILGLGLGLSHGSGTAGLRFRAENAHRLPQTSTGWYLYHKSKNYHMMFGGVKEGLKMGLKMSVWTGLFFWIEDCWDEVRGEKDFLNTLVASASVAGGFSLWSTLCLVGMVVRRLWLMYVTDRFPVTAAARTAKTGLAIGLVYGLAQDAVGALRGRRPGYLEFILRGGKRKTESTQMEVT